MSKKMQVKVENVSDVLDRFARTWRRAEMGGTRATEVRLTFGSLPALRRAARRARALGESTGTPVYVLREGVIVNLARNGQRAKKAGRTKR